MTGPFARSCLLAGIAATVLTGCATTTTPAAQLPAASYVASKEQPGEEYVIGPLDQLNIFVWRNPELTAKVQVRPDGRITTPLVNDMPAVGKTPAMLADDMTKALSEYISKPIVSVIVENFSGTFSQQVRIVGATEITFKVGSKLNDGPATWRHSKLVTASSSEELVPEIAIRSPTWKTGKKRSMRSMRTAFPRAAAVPAELLIVPAAGAIKS